ncbi:MAG: hypothetical protein SR3Q1_10835, partial [Quinella sp. 3Q1]|nr:hypothetical protein [Quinella sp. 3Q1]
RIYEYILNKSKAKVIAFTGSVGKTTAIGLLEKVLKEKYNVMRIYSKRITPINLKANIINFLNEEVEYIVLENSLYYHDHVKILSTLLKPEIVSILNIKSSHLGVEKLNTVDDDILLDNDPAEKNADITNFSLSNFISQAYDSTPKTKEGYVLFSRLGESMRSFKPDFDYTDYGFKTFKQMIDAFSGEYEILDDGKPAPSYMILRKEIEEANRYAQGVIRRIINIAPTNKLKRIMNSITYPLATDFSISAVCLPILCWLAIKGC